MTANTKELVLPLLVLAAGMAGAAPWRIGIVDKCATDGTLAGENYVAFVRVAGAEPVLLRATDDKAEIERMLDGCDLLLFAGGEDVDPSRYGEKPSPKLGKVNARRDAWEFAVLDAAVPRRKPLFGICRGCQLLNVYFGGTLWQDLPSEFEGCRPEGHYLKDGGEHDVVFEPDSRLAKRMGLQSTTVNSTHHQAVKTLGRGFRVAARSPEGVVEAIENDEYPAAAVQFHPERLVVQKGRREFRRLLTDVPPVKAGLYCGPGSRGGNIVYWAKILEDSPDVKLTLLDADDIRAGGLKGLDILVMPGGSGRLQCNALAEEGKEAIRRYVREGGKYFGTCAGISTAINATNRLQMAPYQFITNYYERGSGTLQVAFNEKWRKELALADAQWELHYHGGPIVIPGDAVPDGEGETMAVCLNAIEEREKRTPAERDAMIGTPAFIYATFGKGEVIACNTHPEARPETRELISAVFGRLTGRRIAIPSVKNLPKGYNYSADGTKETLRKAMKVLK